MNAHLSGGNSADTCGQTDRWTKHESDNISVEKSAFVVIQCRRRQLYNVLRPSCKVSDIFARL